MSAPTGLPLADTSDMVALHRVFRDALSAAPGLVGPVQEGDRDRAGLVATYYTTVLDLLHAHHEGEDELLTPRLLERAPEHADTIARIAGQHEVVLDAIAGAERTVAAWRDDPTVVAREAAVAALGTLDAALVPHLDEEEREILPIAAGCIDVAEWGELPEHGMKAYRGDELWLLLGLVREQMSDEQLAVMDAHVPPPVAELWQGPGQQLFTDFVTELRGS